MKKTATIGFILTLLSGANTFAIRHGLPPEDEAVSHAKRFFQTLENPLDVIAQKIDNLSEDPSPQVSSAMAFILQKQIKEATGSAPREQKVTLDTFAKSILLFSKLVLEHDFCPHFRNTSQQDAMKKMGLYLRKKLSYITSNSRISHQLSAANMGHAHIYRAMIMADIYNQGFVHPGENDILQRAWEELQKSRAVLPNGTKTVSLLESVLILEKGVRPFLPNNETPTDYAARMLILFETENEGNTPPLMDMGLVGAHGITVPAVSAAASAASSSPISPTAGHSIYARQFLCYRTPLLRRLKTSLLQRRALEEREQEAARNAAVAVAAAASAAVAAAADDFGQAAPLLDHTLGADAMDTLYNAAAYDDAMDVDAAADSDDAADQAAKRVQHQKAPLHDLLEEAHPNAAAAAAAAAAVPSDLAAAQAMVAAASNQATQRGRKRSAEERVYRSTANEGSRPHGIRNRIVEVRHARPDWDAKRIATETGIEVGDILPILYPDRSALTREEREEIRSRAARNESDEKIAREMNVGYYQVVRTIASRHR